MAVLQQLISNIKTSIKCTDIRVYQSSCCNISYLWRFKEHLSLVHRDLVGAGLWRPEEDDVLVREGLQWFGLAPLVHRHVLGADAQPEVMREAAFLALEGQENKD